MECFGGGVNRMVCGGVWVVDGGWIDWGLDRVGLSLVGLGWIGLGDCVWCVLLPEFVANATASSRTTPRG